MKKIDFECVKSTVAALVVQANTVLRPDVFSALRKARTAERSVRAKKLLGQIIDNAAIAKKEKLAVCQDTGLPIVFVRVGSDVIVSGKGIEQAIQAGVRDGYRQGNLRNSVVRDPLRLRKQPSGFCPAIIHYEYNASRRLIITVLPKGFGCENKSQLKMFLPTAGKKEIMDFVIGAVKNAGPDACPPYVVGVGIGGSADYAGFLAKKALLLPLTGKKSAFERELLARVNRLGIGPMGLGGRTTALSVSVMTYPTHIAGLPVAVNISCHALRSASAVLK